MKIVSVVKKKKNPKEVLQMAKLRPEQDCEDAEPSMLEGGGRVLGERTSCPAGFSAQCTFQVLILPPQDFLAHGALLVAVPELQELDAEGAGLLF